MSDRPRTPPDQGIRRRTAPQAPGRSGRRAPRPPRQGDPDADAERQSRFEDNMNDAGNEADAQAERDRITGRLPPRSTGGPALSQESLRF